MLQVHSLAWNADGTKLAFVAWSETGPRVMLLDLSSDTPVATTLCEMEDGESWEQLNWARTKDVLVFRSYPDSLICTYDMDTGVVTELFEGREPCWSPDDTQIVYLRPRAQRVKGGLYVYTFASGSQERILGGGRMPDWRR
jgi:hypothetical protein